MFVWKAIPKNKNEVWTEKGGVGFFTHFSYKTYWSLRSYIMSFVET